MIISFGELTRRHFMKRAAAAAALGMAPSAITGSALAATEDERILAAAKGVKPVGLRGMIWSNYMAAMKSAAADFKSKTGIGIESSDTSDTKSIPPMSVRHRIRSLHDPGKFSNIANLLANLVILLSTKRRPETDLRHLHP